MEINLFPKFLDEAVMPVAKKAGSTLSSIWTIAFGGIDIYAEKTQLKRVHALNQFKDELEQAVSSIPEENIIEPPLHIVGPSLEASKYYFESDELRTMFAQLIASSINRETTDQVHPSFVEIIKQLSTLDALNLKLFKVKQTYPIGRIDFTSSDGGSAPYKTHVFLENEEVLDIESNATSISNLDRLGLVTISYERHLADITLYEKYKNHPYYQEVTNQLKEHNANLDTSSIQYENTEIMKGLVSLTPLGENFIKICI